MRGPHSKHHKKDESSDSCSDTSSSLFNHEKPKHEKRHKRRSESSESCDTDKKSEIESYSNDKEWKHKDRKHRKSCTSSSSSSSSSSSDTEHCYDFNQIYQYFKNRLVLDPELMVQGSKAYVNAVNHLPESLPKSHSVNLEDITVSYHIENPKLNAPFFVRESGIYLIVFVIDTNNAAQFTIFVNEESVDYTTTGTNSGAGQVIIRRLLKLNKDDCVVVRNYISDVPAVDTTLYHGGLQPGVDANILMFKIAPLCNPRADCDEIKCYSHNKLKLFKKIAKRLVLDPELMVRGFNVTGSFYTKLAQNVATESDVIYDTFQNVNGMVWNPTGTNPEQVKVLESGVYHLRFVGNTDLPTQFAFTVNGVPVDNSIQGVNRGAAQPSIRILMQLNANDIVTVRNHTSLNSSINLTQHSGGEQFNINACLTIYKVAQIAKPEIKHVDCKIEKRFCHVYEKLRNYLLCKECLQITGTPAYIDAFGANTEYISVDQPFNWAVNAIIKDVYHVQGKDEFIIEKPGLYNVFACINTNEPAQIALFVNGMPEPSAIFGRDSGASTTTLTQFIKFNKGDKLVLRNYQSNSDKLLLTEVAGGQRVAPNKSFSLFRLNPACEPDFCDKPEKPYKPYDKPEKPKNK